MPELPEVQTVVDTLRPALLGRRVSCVSLLRPDMLIPRDADLASSLHGAIFTDIHRRGKKILLCVGWAYSPTAPSPGETSPTARELTLCIHLGMTGRLTVVQPSTPQRAHTHLVIDLTAESGDARQLRFVDPRRFGRISLLASCDQANEGLGPEPLTVRSRHLAQRLARTRRAIKTALLDQKLLAGLGNIYADEALFAAAIHPLTPANRLTEAQIQKLTRSIKTILRRAINSRGSSFRDYVDANGQAGTFQRLHRVYAREDQPCRTCKTPIQRIVISGRSAHFCPRCQSSSPSKAGNYAWPISTECTSAARHPPASGPRTGTQA